MSLICSLEAHPPQGWECLKCGDQGRAFDLITHTDGKAHCIFHRMCYPRSESGKKGICQGCGLFLHENLNLLYVTSDSDEYRMPDYAFYFRMRNSAQKKKIPFDGEKMKVMVRSASWDGERPKATAEEASLVKESLKSIFEKEAKRLEEHEKECLMESMV